MTHTLTSTNFTFTEANTTGGVTYSRDFNPDSNLRFGGTAMAKIEFTVLDWNDDIFFHRVVYPLVFNDGETYLTLADGTKVGLYQRSESVSIIGEEFQFILTDDNGVSTNMGYFTVETVERVDSTKVKVTAYDRMRLLSASADAWLASVSFPRSTNSLLSSLATNLGLTVFSTSGLNTSYSIPKGFSATGVTYRDVLSWLCEARGQFAYITPNGNLQLAYYSNTATTFSSSNTMGTNVAEYNINPYQALQIRASDSDLGVTVGANEPKYVITGNPLFFNASTTAITEAAKALLARVNVIAYTPATFTFWQDSVSLLCGKRVTLKTEHNPTDGYPVFVMSESINNNRHTVTCVGNPYTINTRSSSTQIKQLQGKTAELKVELDELSSTYTDTAQNLQSQITQNASEISTKVSKNGVISAINQSAEAISISASKVNLNGYVTVNGLKTAGQTVINGANITTDTISASRIRGGTFDGDKMTIKNLNADSITAGTIDARNVTINGINASNITSGQLSGNLLGDISAAKLTSGTLSTARLNKGDTADYLSGDNYLCKTRGTFRGSILYDSNGGGGLYKQGNGRVTIDGGDYPIIFTGGSVIFSLGGGTITVNGRPTFNYGIQGPLTIYGSYTATGTKNALVETEHYGKRKTYCYEMSEVLFGDIGEGEVKGGRCEIIIDPIFAETVNTEKPYQVFLTPYGRGQIWVAERLPDKFIVEGDDIKFAYEIKAKRRGFETERLEEVKEGDS